VVIIDVMTLDQLKRRRGRQYKYSEKLMDAVIQEVASSDKTIKAICEEFGVNYSTGRTWVVAARERLGDQATSLDPLKINHAEEGHVSIQAHSTSATTPIDTEEENGSKAS
jgi:transposase-like protein